MTSEAIAERVLAWKQMALSFDPDFYDGQRTYSGVQVHRLLNSLTEWLMGYAIVTEIKERHHVKETKP